MLLQEYQTLFTLFLFILISHHKVLLFKFVHELFFQFDGYPYFFFRIGVIIFVFISQFFKMRCVIQ